MPGNPLAGAAYTVVVGPSPYDTIRIPLDRVVSVQMHFVTDAEAALEDELHDITLVVAGWDEPVILTPALNDLSAFLAIYFDFE